MSVLARIDHGLDAIAMDEPAAIMSRIGKRERTDTIDNKEQNSQDNGGPVSRLFACNNGQKEKHAKKNSKDSKNKACCLGQFLMPFKSPGNSVTSFDKLAGSLACGDSNKSRHSAKQHNHKSRQKETFGLTLPDKPENNKNRGEQEQAYWKMHHKRVEAVPFGNRRKVEHI